MAEKAKYCPECGKEVGVRKYCPFCGAAVKSNLPAEGAGERGDASGTVTASRGDQQGTVVTGREAPPAAGSGPPSSDTVMLGRESTLSEKVSRLAAAREAAAASGPTGAVPAESFGRYRVVREAGRGAMGIVYLARDDRIGRNVAVKTLHMSPGLSQRDREQVAERFEREGRAAGRLSHPNIVTVHDVGEERGTPYIAMEYLEGATLTELLSEGPLSIRQATDVIAQVLSALEYAHGHEVVHRDIKPDNVFVLADGRVKVADFGIARLASDSTMTRAGAVMGTPGYMSPEQVKGETVGPASDIFSVGVLLYELLTGTPAFGSTSPTSIMYKIVHEEPRPPHLVNPGVPPYLEAVTTRACAKNPSARYSDAASMKADIESGRPAEPAPAPVSHDGTIIRTTPVFAPIPPAVTPPEATIVPGPAPGAPAKKRTGLWAAIAAAAALLVIGIVIAVIVLAGGGEGGGKNGKDGTTTTEKPKPPAVTDLNTYVTSVSASSTLLPDTPGVNYIPDNVKDGNPDTGWAEGVPGYGEGQSLDFTFREPVVIKDVKAIPGYKRFYKVDRYIQNGKLNQVTLTFQDGSTRTISFRLDPNWQAADWQTVPIEPPVRTQTVKVTIASVYPGQESGRGAATDTTVSEFHFEGYTAAAEDAYNEALE